MSTVMVTLRFRGGGSLTFQDGDRPRQRVVPGETFDVTAETAAVLLDDPDVILASDTDGEGDPAVVVVAPEPPEPVKPPTKADLQERATELGLQLPSRATVADLTSAIEAKEAELAAVQVIEATAGSGADSGGPDGAGGDATPPATSDTDGEGDDEGDPTLGHQSDLTTPVAGTITVDSLPASARIAG